MKRLFILIGIIIMAGCSAKESPNKAALKEFTNQEYKFSLHYPNEWTESTETLPDKWAIVDAEKNAIMVLVSKNEENATLRQIGYQQAIYDLNINSTEQLSNLIKFVKIGAINDKEWYTYAIDYNKDGTKAIVSGTLCHYQSINFILVSKNSLFEKNKEIYSTILGSFECQV